MIRLSVEEVSFALGAVRLPSPLCSRLCAASGTRIELQDDEAELLLDLVTDRLMTHGFDACYRPTEAGRALERLVDRLSADGDAAVGLGEGG